MEELELLHKIKNELLDKGEITVQPLSQAYNFKISYHDWHEIFKTEEYNEKKKEDGK